MGVSGALFFNLFKGAPWISCITSYFLPSVLAVHLSPFQGCDMKRLILRFVCLLFLSHTTSLFAASQFQCNASSQTASLSAACSYAKGSSSPEAFISKLVSYVSQNRPSDDYSNYTAKSCTAAGSDFYMCGYSFTYLGNVNNFTVFVESIKTADCPETIENRGPNSTAVKSADNKYYVIWQASSVTSDICHNSCSYSASSVAVSKCYLATGSTTTGFCNYFVALDTESPSCSGESGYLIPVTGDPLNPSGSDGDEGSDEDPDPGDPGDNSDPSDGGDTDPSPGGEGGSGNSGGSSGGTATDIVFSNPGSLEIDALIKEGVGEARYTNLPLALSIGYNASNFGAAVNQLQDEIALNAQSATCPTPSMNLFGTDFVIDAHCTFLELILPDISAVFMAGWVIAGILIVL